MDDVKAAPTVGLVGCLLVLAVLTWPYLQESASSVSLYYATSALTPLAAGLLAFVGIVVFAAGREERSDPNTVAGAALALSLFVLVIAVAFGLTARVDVLGAGSSLLSYQRHALVAVALVPLAGAVWYARALRLL